MSATGRGRSADILNLPYGDIRREDTGRREDIAHRRLPEPPYPAYGREPAPSTRMPLPSGDTATRDPLASRLRQAADAAARRNEERAKAAQAEDLTRQLYAAEARIRSLEQELRWFEHRALEAEEWLERVLREAQETLYEPLRLRSRG